MASYKNDEWLNAQGSVQGRRAYVRKNVSLLNTAKAEFPWVVIVNLAYQPRDEDGMPAYQSELENLDATEESVADQMHKAFGALFGLVVTSDGTRDLFFFLPHAPHEDALQTAIEAADPSVDYDFFVRDDPDWRPYVQLLPTPRA